jgi:large subunit ribosomal protein L25
MSEITIEVQTREGLGKNANRRTRVAGGVPGVLYGGGKDTVPIQVNRKSLVESIKQGGGGNTIFLLKLAGTAQSRHAMIRDLQVDPISRHVVHVDFQRILMTEKIRVKVAVHATGVAYGVKNDGAILDFPSREVEIESLPGDIPPFLELDVTELRVNHHLEAKDLKMPSGVTLLTEDDKVLVSCVYSKAEQAAEATAEALLEAGKAEPEVIKKGKPEDEKAADAKKPAESKDKKK